MVANCSPAPGAFTRGVGRHTPMAAGDPTMPRTPRNGGGGGVNPSVWRHAQMLSATDWPHATPAWIDAAFPGFSIAAMDASRCVVSDAVWVAYSLIIIA